MKIEKITSKDFDIVLTLSKQEAKSLKNLLDSASFGLNVEITDLYEKLDSMV